MIVALLHFFHLAAGRNRILRAGDFLQDVLRRALLLDASVDQQLRDNIEDSSILIISHQERILSIADEIVVIKGGSIERQGPKDEILPSLIGTEMAMGGCPRGLPWRKADA